MYFFTDPLPFFLAIQKFRFLSDKLQHVKKIARLTASAVLILILAVAIPFATQARQSVSYAQTELPVTTIPVASTTASPQAKIAPDLKPVEAVALKPVEAPKNEQVQSAIDSWVASHGGTVSVSVRGITDPSINASNKGVKTMYTASIYKLYAVELTYARINAGTWTGSQGGLNIDQCVKQMILISDNNCAVAFGYLLGWQATNNELKTQGFGNTSLDENYPWSCASDVAELLVRLEQGALVSAGQREAMLGYMKQQIYRNGIPAGNPGVAVANKVGFSGTTNTDAGIVYGPKGTYVVSVMTENSSFIAIKDLSATIAAVMNK